MYWGFKEESHCTEYSVDKWTEIGRDQQIACLAGAVQVVFSIVTVRLDVGTTINCSGVCDRLMGIQPQREFAESLLSIVQNTKSETRRQFGLKTR
jgi:hypothetical protein